MKSLKLAILLFAVQNLLSGSATAQSKPAEGKLMVTAMVESSVGVVMDDQGNPKIVVANAAGPGDNVSGLTIISTQANSTAATQEKTMQKWKRK